METSQSWCYHPRPESVCHVVINRIELLMTASVVSECYLQIYIYRMTIFILRIQLKHDKIYWSRIFRILGKTMSLKQIQTISQLLLAGSIYWLIYQIRISAWFSKMNSSRSSCESNDPKTKDRYISSLHRPSGEFIGINRVTNLFSLSFRTFLNSFRSMARWSNAGRMSADMSFHSSTCDLGDANIKSGITRNLNIMKFRFEDLLQSIRLN